MTATVGGRNLGGLTAVAVGELRAVGEAVRRGLWLMRPMVPQEHGAWAMILVPALIGVGIAGRPSVAPFLFLVTCLLLFMARYPLEVYLRRRSRVRTGWLPLLWSGLYLAPALALGAWLLGVQRYFGLLSLAAAALALLALRLYLRERRRQRALWLELLAVAALSSTAFGANYIALGAVRWEAALVWVLSFLYFGSSVFYVRLMSSPGREASHEVALIVYLAVLSVILAGFTLVRALPLLVLVAFLPLVGKAAWALLSKQQATLKRIGIGEVAHAAFFAVVLVAAYRVSPLLGLG